MKTCKKCGVEQPIKDFRVCRLYKGSSDGQYTRSECKGCEKKASRQLSEAKKNAPPKPPTCECCDKKTPNLVLDHCHGTGDFRGWICRNCNQGVGKLGDDVEGLQRAMNYLKGEVMRLADIDGRTINAPEHYHEALKQIGLMIESMEAKEVDRSDMAVVLHDLMREAEFHLQFLPRRTFKEKPNENETPQT